MPGFPTDGFGTFTPGAWGRFWLGVARGAPRRWPGSRVALLARRLARLGIQGPVDTELWGHRLRLFASRGVSEARILFLPQFWDSQERQILRDFCSSGCVFFDVGANVGGYTFWVDAVTERSATIVAVEADPGLVDQLRFNVGLNQGEDRIAVMSAAVATEEGKGVLYLDQGNRGENRLLAGEDQESGDHQVGVRLRRLPDLVRESGVDRIDALKIDVEGGEVDILQTLFEEMGEAFWPGLLIVELHDEPGVPPVLAEHGYRRAGGTRLNGVFTRAGVA